MKKIISFRTLSFLLAVIFVFSLCACNKENSEIDLSNKIQKTIRYDFASFRTEKGVETSPKQVEIRKYFGTYGDGAMALIIDSECEAAAQQPLNVVLAGCMFELEDHNPIYIYSNYKFTELKEAHASGIISDSDVVALYKNFCEQYNIKVRGSLEALDERVAEIIKENYVQIYLDNGLELTVDHVQINGYFGIYSGAYALFIKSDTDTYPQTPITEAIKGVQFEYPNSEVINIYKNGKFYRLKEACDAEIVTVDDLKDIRYYFELNNG